MSNKAGLQSRYKPDAPSADSALFMSDRLERVFDSCFAQTQRTVLRGGADEPLYQPAPTASDLHCIYYREDFFASALHEVAHWCIAGRERRQQVDFGYWYAPDGRSRLQQQSFERVERKPQALEWILSQACGYRFHLSADNLSGAAQEPTQSLEFARQVLYEARQWQVKGLPGRAGCFYAALFVEFDCLIELGQLELSLEQLL